MANLNRIILVGRLTNEPEGRSTADGNAMSKYRLAVNRPQGGADFIDIVAWGQAAETSNQYLKKGSMVLVEGRIQVRTFEDQTGQKRWVTEVVARKVQMMDKVTTGQSLPTGAPSPTSNVSAPEEAIDDESLAGDLPF